MFTLIASVSCSVAVSVFLKLARRQNIDVAQAIAFNYVMACALCFFLLQPDLTKIAQTNTTYGTVIALGLLLPSVFIIMAKAVQHSGIVLSDAAQRLSLVIPLIAAATLFGETMQSSKWLGIALGLSALLCLTAGAKKAPNQSSSSTYGWLLLVWVGYGVIDVLFKQLAKAGTNFSTGLFITFSLAGVLLFSWLFIKRTQWHIRPALAGLFLGLLNFGNIYFYLRAHQQFPDNPTLVFSTMNIGVISLGTLVGAAVFKEKLYLISLVGLALALGAIALLIPR